jgi:DNA-binding transcriptional regulator WhiA
MISFAAGVLRVAFVVCGLINQPLANEYALQ